MFNFENIDKSTEAQREDLIQRVLKLGGDNYTCENLKRDLLNIENEDKDMSHSQISGNKIYIEQRDKVVGKDSGKGSDSKMGNQSSLINQILRDLENEDTKGKDSNKLSDAQNAQKTNLDQLGIQMNQEGLNSPKCTKLKARRGMKSLKELREADG